MWISITAGGLECNLNQFLSRYSYAAAVLWCLSVCLSVKRVTKRKQVQPVLVYRMKTWFM